MGGERISLWAALWVVYLAGERVPGGTVLAAVVGLVGLAFVVGPDGLGGGSVAAGLLVMLAASLSWSRGSFVSRRLSLPADPFVATVYEMLGGGLVLVTAGLAAGEAGRIDALIIGAVVVTARREGRPAAAGRPAPTPRRGSAALRGTRGDPSG